MTETEIKESRGRVRSAIINSRFEFPIRRITINLAPADLPKEGGRFDLPIALGVLTASQQKPSSLSARSRMAGTAFTISCYANAYVLSLLTKNRMRCDALFTSTEILNQQFPVLIPLRNLSRRQPT